MMLGIQTTQFNHYETAAKNLEVNALKLIKQHRESNRGSSLFSTIRNLFYSPHKPFIFLGKECCKLLDQVEKIPAQFNTEDQKPCYSACIRTATIVASIISSLNSPKLKPQMQEVMLKVAALRYRIEAANGGLDCEPVNQALVEKLGAAAKQWKQNEVLILNKDLSPQEIKKLEEVSAYPDFAKILVTSASLQEKFFNSHFRDNNEVRPAILFPATFARLKSVFIASRTGKIPEALQIIKQTSERTGIQEKIIALPFCVNGQKKSISILDESKIVQLDRMDERREKIIGSKIVTIGEIFKDFSERNQKMGEYELFADKGITFWNCHKLGSMDITLDDWWKRLPIVEALSKQQLESRISDTLQEGEWVVFAKASRCSPDMDLDRRHGYLEVAIPLEDGSYGVYPFGIFPQKFPDTMLELVVFLGNTARAKISYPDENFFYSHRQQATHPIKLTAEEGVSFMKTLQRELILAQYGHKIFQFGAENCAYWAQKTLNTIPGKEHNYFKIDYVKSYPLNPVLKRLFNLMRSSPNLIRNRVIGFIDLCFGSSRGFNVFENRKRVYKSHNTSHVRNEFVIYQPGHLHKQIQDGLKGSISLGNC